MSTLDNVRSLIKRATKAQHCGAFSNAVDALSGARDKTRAPLALTIASPPCMSNMFATPIRPHLVSLVLDTAILHLS
jgi:hypothetical protein